MSCINEFDVNVVVGCSGDIGVALSSALIKSCRESDFVGTYFLGQAHERLVEIIPLNNDDRVKFVECDLTDTLDVERLVSLVSGRRSRIFFAHGIRHVGPFDPSSVEQMIAVNTTSTCVAIDKILDVVDPLSYVGVFTSIAGNKTLDIEEVGYAASKRALSILLDGLRVKGLSREIQIVDFQSGAIQSRMCAEKKGYAKLIDVNELAAFVISQSATCFASLYNPVIQLQRTRY